MAVVLGDSLPGGFPEIGSFLGALRSNWERSTARSKIFRQINLAQADNQIKIWLRPTMRPLPPREGWQAKGKALGGRKKL